MKEHRLAELIDNERLYRLLAENARDVIWIRDLDLRLTYVSPSVETVRGFTAEEALRQQIEEVLTPSSARLAVETFLGMLPVVSDGQATPEELSIELEHRCKDGRTIWMDCRISALRDDAGAPVGILGVSRDVDDRRRAEAALRESERFASSLLRSAPHPIVVINPDSSIRYVNEAFETLAGFTAAEVLGIRAPYPWWTPSTLDRTRTDFDHAMQKGPRRVEERFQKKDGTAFWVEITSMAVHSDEGLDYYIANWVDITERKRVEARLHQSEAHYRLLVENQNELVVQLDRDLRILFLSPSYCRTFGKTEDAIRGRTFFPLIHDDDHGPVRRSLERVLNPPYESRHEERALTVDGWRWFAWSAKGVTDAEGTVSSIVSVGRDITEQRRAEEALRASEARFRSAFHTSPDSINLNRLEDGAYIDINEGFTRIMGYGREEVLGKSSLDLTIWKNSEDRRRLVEGLRRDGVVANLEAEFVAKDGSIRNGLMSARILQIDGEHVILSITRDMTEHKRFERQLHESQKIEFIGTLAGGIAHDFNNILFPIVGMSEMLMEDFAPGSPGHDSAREIFQAAMRGSDLVKQILAVSRRSEHRRIPVRLQTVVEEALKLARSTIPSDIDIEADLPHDGALILADPTQIHQVAMNLITNAYHAVEKTGGRIAVRIEPVAAAETDPTADAGTPGFARLTVSDTGCGMAPEIIERIFEPYFTTKPQGKGTGLGLAVVYGIVRELGGDIRVDSEIGSGAVFSVDLPLMTRPEPPSAAPPATATERGSERILLVDDEPSVLHIEQQILERAGYAVTARSGSIEALAAFRNDPRGFDLVISDMTMPAMTGERLAEALLAIRADLPIVLCTGFSERIDEARAKARGIRGFLMKPVVRNDLLRIVRSVLDSARGRKK